MRGRLLVMKTVKDGTMMSSRVGASIFWASFKAEIILLLLAVDLEEVMLPKKCLPD